MFSTWKLDVDDVEGFRNSVTTPAEKVNKYERYYGPGRERAQQL